MAQSIQEVMTADPRTVDMKDSVIDAARHVREGDTGAIVVTDSGKVAGIVTDRDIAVRAVADGKDPQSTKIGDICTTNPSTLTTDQSVEDAISMMRDQNIRRVPVLRDDRPAGIVSIGDLAMERDEDSALADISAAAQNN